MGADLSALAAIEVDQLIDLMNPTCFSVASTWRVEMQKAD